MPLIPSVLKSLGDSNLRKLHDLMTKNQIGVVVHSSANKGVTTKTNSIINEEGVKITNKEHPFNDFYNKGALQNHEGPVDRTQFQIYPYQPRCPLPARICRRARLSERDR